MKTAVLNCYVKILYSIITIFLSSVAANAGPIEIEFNQFHEYFTESVNISGSMRAGVMYESETSRAAPDSLQVDLTNAIGSVLCVTLLSVDGKYGADFSYTLTGETKGRTAFKLPTEKQEIITSYSPEQLAIFAQVKPVCKGAKGVVVPAFWGNSANSNVLNVYLNSAANSTFLMLYGASGDAGDKGKILCKRIDADDNTAYNTQCTINDIQKYNLEKTVIIRSNFGKAYRPVKLKIMTPKS